MSNNMAVTSDFISDRFLYRGVTKKMALQFLRGMSDYTATAELIITKFAREDDDIVIDVWLKDKYFESAFMIETKLIKEDGQWRWYGNQLSN
jgi:hypothetical protein